MNDFFFFPKVIFSVYRLTSRLSVRDDLLIQQQQRRRRSGRRRRSALPEPLVLLLPPEPVSPAGAVPPAHGRHQQPGALPCFRPARPLFAPLPGDERQHAPGAARHSPLPVLLPVAVPSCPAGLEQPAAAGVGRGGAEQPQQQDHQH